jgi:UDP-N-acetylglucosamine 2-epimerase (non-hydrolysing)
MSTAPLFSVSALTAAHGPGVVALHLAVSRSAALRLASVAAGLSALGAPQALVDLEGERALDPDAPPHAPAATASVDAVEVALDRLRPAFVVVAGDGEAAVEAALAAFRRDVPIARLGAGLRCGDRGVHAEVNRLVLDELAGLLLVDGEDAADLLRGEGVDEQRIRCVGSTVADATLRWRGAAARSRVRAALGLAAGKYVLVTLNKRENIGDDGRVARITEALSELAGRLPVVVCLHPETRAAMQPTGDVARLRAAGAIVTGTLGYLDFLALELAAGAVLTDSGTVQEETTVLGVPCFTFANGSERTLTLTHGTNIVLGDDPADIAELAVGAHAGKVTPIPLWDGAAGRRAAAELLSWSPA